jgi:hypothetical protein
MKRMAGDLDDFFVDGSQMTLSLIPAEMRKILNILYTSAGVRFHHDPARQPREIHQ